RDHRGADPARTSGRCRSSPSRGSWGPCCSRCAQAGWRAFCAGGLVVPCSGHSTRGTAMKFEIYRQRGLNALTIGGGEWRWRLKAANGEIIAQGESYTSKQNCLHAIQLVMGTSPITAVVEL